MLFINLSNNNSFFNRNLVVIRRVSEEEIIKKIEASHAKEWEELETAVGFSLVARKISSSVSIIYKVFNVV